MAEGVDTVHHLVILSDNMLLPVFAVLLAHREFVDGIGVISQTASLTKLLEYDTVHASTKVFIEEFDDRTTADVILFALVAVYTEVDIVRFVRSNEYLRLGGKVPIPLLIYRNLGKMLGSLVVLSYDSIELFQA